MIEENFIRKLIASIKCGSCGQPYQESYIDVIERNDELWFVKVVCSSCHAGCVVAAVIREEKKARVITDLTESEIEKFRYMKDVNEDDLLGMHDFLKDFDGNFPRVFRRK